MAYPFNNTFDVAPDSSYVYKSPVVTWTYNSTYASIDAVGDPAATFVGILAFNEGAALDFFFEADLELVSDAVGRKHLGVFLLSTDGYGHRFGHLDGYWNVTRYDTNVSGTTSAVVSPFTTTYEHVIGEGISKADGSVPTYYAGDKLPTFNAGERRVLRVERYISDLRADGTKMEMLRFFCGGALAYQYVGPAMVDKALLPGVFCYINTIRVHSISGGTPSGIPTAISANAWNAALGNAFLATPPGSMSASAPNSPMGTRNIYQGGSGFVAGNVKELPKGALSGNEVPVWRRVQLIDEQTRLLVAETWSDPVTGVFRFDNVVTGCSYTILSYDHNGVFRAVVADRVAAVGYTS